MLYYNIYHALRRMLRNVAEKIKAALMALKNLPFAVTRLILGSVVAAVLVMALLLSGIFDSDYDTVAKAFRKSFRAYAAVADTMNLPDFDAFAQKGKFSQQVEFCCKDGADVLNGAGFRAHFSYNQPSKKAAFVGTAFQDGTDLLTARMKVDDEKVYFGYDQLTGKSYFMINTTTLGVDLQYHDINDYPQLSFRIFSLIQQLQDAGTLSKQQKKTLNTAAKELVAQIRIEKQHQQPVAVNGTELPCDIYTMTLPQDAAKHYLDAIEAIVQEMNYAEAVESILAEAGFPLEQMNINIDDDSMEETISALRRIIGSNGDLQMEIALHKGYVVSLQATITDGFYQYCIDLQLGGGKKYVDNFYLQVLERMGNGFAITSSGNHTTGGTFTDHTVFTTYTRHQASEDLSWEVSWKPRGWRNNFRCALQSGGEALVLEGTVRCNKRSLRLSFDSVQVDGYTFDISYALGGYRPIRVPVRKKLDYFYMAYLPADIQENYIQWTNRMKDEYSDLLSLLSKLPL